MSLPTELINRPPVAAPQPVVALSLWRVAGRALWLLLPILAYGALQAPGLRWQYASADVTNEIESTRLERRRLIAEKARLLDPARLKQEAARLGLAPAAVDGPPVVLTDTDGEEHVR